jgi:LysR family glycine cleavage system transcriptional activator
MQTDLLLCQNVFPVCSPDLITDTHPLDQPQDLKHFPLLHYDTGKDLDAGWPNWQMWLMAAGATDIDTRHGSTLDQHEMLVQAAVQGQGVALVGSVAVTDDINSGRLVKPFELSFPLELAFYFVTTPTKSQWPKIVAVREWIFSQAKKVLNAQDF